MKTATETVEYCRRHKDIALVIVDLSFSLDIEPAAFLKLLHHHSHAEVVFCHAEKPTLDTVQILVNLVKQGAYDMIQLPTFTEEIQWIVSKAFSFFRLKSRILATQDHDQTQRTEAFLELLIKRQKKGLAVTPQEIQWFFPHVDEAAIPIKTLLEKVNNLPRDFSHLKVVVADDEPAFRDLVRLMLDPYGYQIQTVASGAAVLEVLENAPVDVLLLDIALGDKLGSDLVPVIKKNHPTTIIIMVTAFRDSDLIVSTIRSGASDYVVKGRMQPVLPQKIALALQERYFKTSLSELIPNH
ncbi:MAG: response regulator [Candidatus Margulisiibacteriota bacterium]